MIQELNNTSCVDYDGKYSCTIIRKCLAHKYDRRDCTDSGSAPLILSFLFYRPIIPNCRRTEDLVSHTSRVPDPALTQESLMP